MLPKFRMAKGLSLNFLAAAAITFVVAVIIVSVGTDIIQGINDDQTANSYAANVTSEGLEGMEELGSWFPTIALVIAAAVVIGIVVMAFGGLGKRY